MPRRSPRRNDSPQPEPVPAPSPPLASPLEDLAAPAWVVDRKGAVLGANRSARALEGEAGRGLPVSTPSARELFSDGSEMLRALDRGQPLEACGRGPGGVRRRLLLEPLLGADGAPAGGVLFAPEAGRSRQSSTFWARVLGAASREMLAPLATLRQFAGLARRAAGQGDGRRARLYLNRLERHARRLDYLVGELGDLVDLLSGTAPFAPTRIDLAAEVREVVDAFAQGSRDHVFEIDAPGEVVLAADRDRLRRVLGALLSNAVRFSPEGGRVLVELRSAPRQATLAVVDAGSGVPDWRLAELFDGPCWDPQSASGGLGLGLFLAREVIEMHGGSIRAEPAGPRGTRIVVSLPRVRRV